MGDKAACAARTHEIEVCLCGSVSFLVSKQGQRSVLYRSHQIFCVSCAIMCHTLVLGHSICKRLQECIHSDQDSRMCFKLSLKTSVEIPGRDGLTVKPLMEDSSVLLDSIMHRVLKQPDVIFLQIGSNNFASTAPHHVDVDVFPYGFWR